MTWSDDLAAIEAFREELPDFFDVEDVAAANPPPELADGALRVLAAAFTEVPPPRYDERVSALVELAAMILAARGGYGERVFDEVALRVSHVAAYKELAPLLRLVTGDGLTPLVLRALRGGDDAACMALALGVWAYHGVLASPLTPAEAAEVERAVASLRASARPGSRLDNALALWIPVRAR